jgi:hypothetical protein
VETGYRSEWVPSDFATHCGGFPATSDFTTISLPALHQRSIVPGYARRDESTERRSGG